MEQDFAQYSEPMLFSTPQVQVLPYGKWNLGRRMVSLLEKRLGFQPEHHYSHCHRCQKESFTWLFPPYSTYYVAVWNTERLVEVRKLTHMGFHGFVHTYPI